MVRAEARADVPEREELDACSGSRRRDEYEKVSALPFEPSVTVRAPAGVAERPTPASATSREPDRRPLGARRRHGLLHKERQSPVVSRHEQDTGAHGVAAEEGGSEAPGDVALYRLGRRLDRRPGPASGNRERDQQAPDKTAPHPPRGQRAPYRVDDDQLNATECPRIRGV